MPPRLLLASSSPRRRELLTEAGVEFDVVSPAVAESESAALDTGTDDAERDAKALAVVRARPGSVVLAADTLVALDGHVIGKPADMNEAFAIVRQLSGREHQVCTSVLICGPEPHHAHSFYVISHVQFRTLADAEIAAYLAKINPLDKAGACAAQGHGREIIERIRGSYTNVVGLPMEETLTALSRFGLQPRHAGGASR